MDATFIEFDIVRHLKKNAPELYTKVIELYHLCDAILGKIPYTFVNYTLHDIQHSIRVIGYINELIKDHINQYSDLDIAIIIYTGLLHDTGMFVSDDEKRELYKKFTNTVQDFATYSEEKKNQYLQDYIRERHGKRVNDVLRNKINENANIKSLFCVGQTMSYDLSTIVALICQSHMENTEWLANQPLLNDGCYGNYDIHPRLISILLRTADSLDIDDRRAPYVIYKMLKLQGYSDTEWKKHIPITNYSKIHKKGTKYQITFSGVCKDGHIYRKIADYIDALQDQLINDLRLNTGTIKLNIQLPIIKNIQAVDFQPTSMRFVLDYKQISKLLMGEQIYGNKRVGLRELLQNAIDAVLLMSEIINNSEAYPSYKPIIGVDFKIEDNKIIIYDNGIGMSEDILKNYFFNIGNSYYESSAFSKGNYNYKPIGHFGIGFLACFMLSSKVKLETKSYMANSKLLKMDFEKNSPYIIYYPCDGTSTLSNDHGTRIFLDYDQVIGEECPFRDEYDVERYIKDILTQNNYTFYIHHSDARKELVLKKPQYKLISSHDNVEFNDSLYTIDKSSLFTAREFFSQYTSECVFLYDEENCCYSLNRLEICIQRLKELLKSDSDKEEKRRLFYRFVHNSLLDDKTPLVSRFIQKLLLANKEVVFHLIDTNQDINILYDNILEHFLRNKALKLLTLYQYKSDIRISVQDYDGIFTKADVNHVLILCASSSDLHRLDDILHLEYGLMCGPAVMSYVLPITLMVAPDEKHFIQVYEHKDSLRIHFPDIYIKSVQVLANSNRYISPPYTIKGININGNSEEWYNFKTGQYQLNVSRNAFDDKSESNITNKIICIKYLFYIQHAKIDEIEKKTIEAFLQKYYPQTYDSLKDCSIS